MAVGLGLRQTQHAAQRMTLVLQNAIGLLQMSNAQLSGLLIEEACRNPALTVVLPMPDDSPPPRKTWRQPAMLAGLEALDPDAYSAQAAGLYAHVATQIGFLFSDPHDLRIAAVFADALEPSGWLGESLADIARAARCSHATAERILLRLQEMEPTGLFARSLAECLGLQLAEQGALDAPMQRLLDNLEALGRGDTAALMQRCGVDAAALGRMVCRLRSLDPKPGAQFDTPADLRRPPDLLISRNAQGEWQVALNRASTPELRIASQTGGAGKEALATARWLDRTLSRRNQMILRVAGQVVSQQRDFLDLGPEHLRPLTCAQVAHALGLHETTVGRIRSALLVQTAQRVLPMRALFGRGGIGHSGGAALAGEAMARRIAALIAAEDPAAPLTDEQLSAHLSQDGIPVSRRTITNWRNRTGHPAAAQRKRRP